MSDRDDKIEQLEKIDELESLVEDWKELATQLVEDQMEAARRLALRLGHEDVDVQAPYRKMLRRVKQGRC